MSRPSLLDLANAANIEEQPVMLHKLSIDSAALLKDGDGYTSKRNLTDVGRTVTPTNTEFPMHHMTFPCRARTKDSNHNASSAYLEVPMIVRHGQELICSYDKCKANGTKFRFCMQCRVPVAKKNFRKRHMHDMPQDQTCIPHKRRVTGSFSGTEKECINGTMCPKRISEESNDVRKAFTSQLKGVPAAWIALYHTRPNDGDVIGMNRWINMVLFESSCQRKGDQTRDLRETAA